MRTEGKKLLSAQKRAPEALGDYCQYLKGVGPARAQRLLKLGIETVNDLLTHLPRKYYDRRNLSKIHQLQQDVESCFVGQVLSLGQRRGRSRRSILTAAVGDDTGVVQVVWFNQPYLSRLLKPGGAVIVTGQLRYYRGARQIVNPEFEIVGDVLDEQLVHTGRIVPVYALTSGVSQRYLRDLVARTLDQYEPVVRENLPPSLAEPERLPTRMEALRDLHFPRDWPHYDAAVRRFKLEELFYMQLALALRRRRRGVGPTRPRFEVEFELQKRFVAGLPFELTGAQKKVLQDINADLIGARGAHRLLQGDVGSGKTIIAGAAILAAVEAGYQAALMVPTEILAVQHTKSLRELFEPLGVPVELLIGSLKPGDKRRMHGAIADGSLPVVVGTHALIQDPVRFAKLGLVVIDEQHRFGVRQRAALLGGGTNPHMLVMTATPIPRTLALTAYADLDLSVIDEMPPGRGTIKTRIVSPDKRQAMYEFVAREARQGARAYLLYPLIDDTEKQDVEAAVSAFEELRRGVLRDVSVGLLHGRMTFAEKDHAMREFAAGRTQVLVATTVIEVGIHVPEATVMVIHHPERFGLSQLHQLRGRIGRGGRSGFCLLAVTEDSGAPARDRLKVLARVSDGFEIAEEDLRIRGPGEFFGTRQHGVPGLKLANPAVDGKIVETARRAVKQLLDGDPRLESPGGMICRRYLEALAVDLADHTFH